MSTRRHTRTDDLLDRVACASLVDAMGRLHRHRANILSLVSPAPRRLFGPAATIAYLPYRDDLQQTELGFGPLFHEAVGESPADTVLVLSSGGYPDASPRRRAKPSPPPPNRAPRPLAGRGAPDLPP